MTEYTTDHRDLDCVSLAKINGCTYYELRQIVRDRDGVRETIGRASDWPLIKLTAEKAELEQLLSSTLHQVSESEQHVATLSARLTASEELSVDANCHVVELTGRISLYERHIAALEQALAETQLVQITPAEAETAETAFVQVLAPAESAPREHACPSCPKTFATAKALSGHRAKVHGAYKQLAPAAPPPPVITPIALSLGEAPWKCAECGLTTHARSIERPAICIRYVVAAVDAHTNGHPIAA